MISCSRLLVLSPGANCCAGRRPGDDDGKPEDDDEDDDGDEDKPRCARLSSWLESLLTCWRSGRAFFTQQHVSYIAYSLEKNIDTVLNIWPGCVRGLAESMRVRFSRSCRACAQLLTSTSNAASHARAGFRRLRGRRRGQQQRSAAAGA